MAHTCGRRETAPTMPDPDDYTPGRGLVGQPRGCTYCGSMAPDDFLAAVRDGAVVGPTDKSYKAYLSTTDGVQGKFYFQHLSPEQCGEFIDLYNTGRMVLGYPGAFYVAPYFTRPAPAV